MSYVEILRAKRAIKWVLIIMGVLLVLGVVGRLASMRFSLDEMAHIDDIKNDPASVVQQTTLPDGSKQTIIDNKNKQVHITIVDRGYEGEHIEVLEQGHHAHKPETVYVGTIMVKELPSNEGTLAVIDTNSATFFGDYAIIAFIFALIVATVLGAPFARQSDGHLEIALTTPVSRERYALQTIAVDVAAIVATFALAIVFGIVLHAIFQKPHIAFVMADFLALVIGIIGPIAWYALLAAATASMRRGYGVVIGFAWPVALLVVGLSYLPLRNAFSTFVHYFFWGLSWLDPVKYFNMQMSSDSGQVILDKNAAFEPSMLLLLAVVYCALAVIQWRRVEA